MRNMATILEGIDSPEQVQKLSLPELEQLAAEIREYYVPDFRDWKNHDSFEKAFAQLLEGLKAVVVSHGVVKEGVVPDAEIDRAIARKRAFEAKPERHTFRPTLKR